MLSKTMLVWKDPVIMKEANLYLDLPIALIPFLALPGGGCFSQVQHEWQGGEKKYFTLGVLWAFSQAYLFIYLFSVLPFSPKVPKEVYNS